MREILRSTGSVLVIAGSLFLFALACAEAPMAPEVAQDEQMGLAQPVEAPMALAKEDTSRNPWP
jgi:hypothetical protein